MSVLVPAKFPSLSAIFMAAAASVLLFFVARVLFSLMRLWSCPMLSSEPQEKETSLLSLSLAAKPLDRFLHWDTLPGPLPFTLALPEKSSSRLGDDVSVGLSRKRSQLLPVLNWQPRTGPRFQPPREYSRTLWLVPRLSIDTASTSALRESCAAINGKGDHVATYIPPTKSQSISETLYYLLFPTNVTTADALSPIPFDSIVPPGNQFPPKTHLIGSCGHSFTLDITYFTDNNALALAYQLSGFSTTYNGDDIHGKTPDFL